jgi:acyl carrier protein
LDLQETLQEFISEELLDISDSVGLDADLLSDGMVDSIGMVRLVTFIEESFDIEIPPEDFIIENFRTVRIVADYLQKRKRI